MFNTQPDISIVVVPTIEVAELAPSATESPTNTVSPTTTSTPEMTPTPFGCQKPPDDSSRIVEREHTINVRTFTMLRHAQELYGGDHDFILAITQGSYNIGVEASFGTHDGGGAVDLSVRSLNDFFDVLYDDIDEIILALRQAGFAAWVREQDELYQGSALHIHAIAVGDAELSEAAQLQLTGPEGYFRGYNGLPKDPPIPDKWGEPILCPWMVELGYEDLRN